MTHAIKAVALVAAFATAGCTLESIEGTQGYVDANSIIATGQDQGRDTGELDPGVAAIAYTPDGCQVWIIDDGVEGYASERSDPVSGLPVCNDAFPPGTVVGDYDSGSPGIDDRISGPRKDKQ